MTTNSRLESASKLMLMSIVFIGETHKQTNKQSNKCVSKTQTRHTGGQLKLCATPSSPFQRIRGAFCDDALYKLTFTFTCKGNSFVAHCTICSTQRIENDVYAGLPNPTSVCCDLDLWEGGGGLSHGPFGTDKCQG